MVVPNSTLTSFSSRFETTANPRQLAEMDKRGKAKALTKEDVTTIDKLLKILGEAETHIKYMRKALQDLRKTKR